jgi:hypothetical protein
MDYLANGTLLIKHIQLLSQNGQKLMTLEKVKTPFGKHMDRYND